MRHIAVFVNSLAGKGKPLKVLPALLKSIDEAGYSYELIRDKFPDSLHSFSEIVIVGGDGTINYVINRYPDISIPIGILPAGSGNDFAYSLFPGVHLKDQIVNALHGETRYIDAGLCNGRIFLNCLGVGFDGEVAKGVRKVKWISGKLKYYWVVVKKIISFKSAPMQVSWNGGEISGPVFMVTAANGYRSGGGFKVAPEANWQDGLLELVVIHPLSVWKRFLYLPRIEKGTHMSLSFIENHKTDSVLIQSEKWLEGHLDGELIDGRLFDISVMPGRYLFRGNTNPRVV